jgi:integral membrane protein (TIGR01906 family)
MGARLGAWLVGVSTSLVLMGIAVVPFLTPAYVRLEQDRVGVGSLSGYIPAQLDAVAGSLLGDLVLWQGDFSVRVEGSPVLNDRERDHMLDVRGVFAGLFLVVAAGMAVLALAVRRTRGSEARFAVWRAVGGGARGLAVGIVVLGVVAVLAFDAAFELFHRLFFSAGSYTFDPRTDRLVQLFPESFWSDTAVAVGLVALGLAVVTAWQAGRRAGDHRAAVMLAPSKAQP